MDSFWSTELSVITADDKEYQRQLCYTFSFNGIPKGSPSCQSRSTKTASSLRAISSHCVSCHSTGGGGRWRVAGLPLASGLHRRIWQSVSSTSGVSEVHIVRDCRLFVVLVFVSVFTQVLVQGLSRGYTSSGFLLAIVMRFFFFFWKLSHRQRAAKIARVATFLRPIYTVQLCRMRYAYDKSRTLVVSCKSNPQLAYDCRVRHKECRGLFKHVLKPYDNRSHRQFDIVEIVYDFSLTRAGRAIKIACDNRKQKSYRVNRPLQVMRQLKKIAEKNREKFNVLNFSRHDTNLSLCLCEGGFTYWFSPRAGEATFSKHRITIASKKSLV